MASIHNIARSTAVAGAALILVVGATFAHDAVSGGLPAAGSFSAAEDQDGPEADFDQPGAQSDAPPCHYYGPAGDLSKYDDKDPIGCDMERNHSDDGKQGGNVLLRSGAVTTDHTGIWGTAMRSGKCRP